LLGELVNLLIDNAWKYSEPGKPVVLGLHAKGDRVTFSVQDWGHGIAEEDIARLFTPFFRAAHARQRGIEGLGLGLSIAQRLAHACGGVLNVTSAVGQGSCFSLDLPAAQEAIGEGEVERG
jgi:signal transduction histidine kinase